jgi:O-antigen/teichoic acid export membrane protein
MACLLFSGVATRLLNSIVIIYMARVLGPAAFGKISFAFAIIAYFTILANFGMPLLGAREVARDKQSIGHYVANILTLRLFIALFSFALIFPVAIFLNKPLETKQLIILYGLGVIPSALLLDWAFQGVERMEFVGAANVLGAAAYVTAVLVFVKAPAHLLLVPCFHLCGNLLAVAVLLLVFAKGFGKLRLAFDFSSWQHVLRQALPIGVSIMLIQALHYTDTVMLGFMRSDEEIGYYNAAYKIILLILYVGATYFDAIYPVASNYYKTSLDSLKKLQDYTARIMVTVGIPLVIGGTILARPIMNLLYGPRYEEGVTAFRILIWAVALAYVIMVYARGMLACNRQKQYVKIIATQVVLNIGLNSVLIPTLGTPGAAISRVCAELLGFFFYYREFNKVVPVVIHGYILRPLIASGIMGAFLLLARETNILLLVSVGIGVYVLALCLTGGIRTSDLTFARRAVLGQGTTATASRT